jgi:hypothetical protein
VDKIQARGIDGDGHSPVRLPRKSPFPEPTVHQGSLLPFIDDAQRHVEAHLGKSGADLVAAVRSIVGYDLAMLAHGCPRLSMHCAAMTAAQLLCLAAQLERCDGGLPQEAAQGAASLALQHDADLLAAPGALTQEDVARALAGFCQAATERGIDLVMALALELKGERVRDMARRHHALDAPAMQGHDDATTVAGGRRATGIRARAAAGSGFTPATMEAIMSAGLPPRAAQAAVAPPPH